ncbi:2,3-bisphosphoglycerate-independent phosphoglycerate mutase [Patescibacteria group bacterium]|nr:2,3-bisphosphoglycerate-independent phosphoglycerate mutase [Patescibacteria group bacterium]
MSEGKLFKPVVLVILDGWGVAPPSPGNAINQANIPVFKRLIATYPTCVLQSSGEAVGLPWGEMGNSEVGHLTIGSGKILYQDLLRINHSIINKSFFTNPALLKAIAQAKQSGSRLHLLGLVSSGGVHSSIDHLYALLDLVKDNGLTDVVIHVILDGRDTAYNSGAGFIKDLENKIKKNKCGRIVTVMGRFFAMDRDNHWDRIQAAYEALAKVQGKPAISAAQAIKSSYASRVYDEELIPTVVKDKTFDYPGLQDNDVVIFFNFRSDRARQLTQALSVPGFDKFKVEPVKNLLIVTMTEYDKNLPVEVIFPPEKVEYPLARIIAENNLRQLHLAETEKYAHVTYFFNGGQEQPFAGEDHALIPSPVVTSYDQKPAMSARAITDRFLQEIRRGLYDFIIINYANADMVGHTGNLPATIKAVEILDECLGEIVAATLEFDGTIFITADHGNAEGLINLQTGSVDKEHSNTPVPFIIASRQLQHKALAGQPVTDDLSQLIPLGVLADVAPTILHVLNLPKSKEMTGQSLL